MDFSTIDRLSQHEGGAQPPNRKPSCKLWRTLSPAEQKAEIERVDGLIARVRGPVPTGRFCEVKPQENFKFCSFPWVVPESMKRRQGAKRAARLSAKAWEEWKAANPEKKIRRKRAKTKKLRRSVEEGASS